MAWWRGWKVPGQGDCPANRPLPWRVTEIARLQQIAAQGATLASFVRYSHYRPLAPFITRMNLVHSNA